MHFNTCIVNIIKLKGVADRPIFVSCCFILIQNNAMIFRCHSQHVYKQTKKEGLHSKKMSKCDVC